MTTLIRVQYKYNATTKKHDVMSWNLSKAPAWGVLENRSKVEPHLRFGGRRMENGLGFRLGG